MADLVVALPEPRPEDDEDVVWGLSTARTLWTRGERQDAIVWLRRAAEAAEAAGQAFRASELGLCVTALEEALAAQPAAPPAQPTAPGPSIPPGQELATIATDEDTPTREIQVAAIRAAPQSWAPPPLSTPAPGIAAPSMPYVIPGQPPVPTFGPPPVALPPSVPPAPPSQPGLATPFPFHAPPPSAPPAALHAPSVTPHAPSAAPHAPPVSVLPTPVPAQMAPLPAPSSQPPAVTPAPAPAQPAPEASRPEEAPPKARKRHPRAPILDPWAEEHAAAPRRAVKDVFNRDQDAFLVAHRPTAGHQEEDSDDVVTSAAPLEQMPLKKKLAASMSQPAPAPAPAATRSSEPPGRLSAPPEAIPAKRPAQEPAPAAPTAPAAPMAPTPPAAREAAPQAPVPTRPTPAAGTPIPQVTRPSSPAPAQQARRPTIQPAAPPTSVRPSSPPPAPTLPEPARRPTIQPAAPPTSVKPAVPPAPPSQDPARRPSIQPSTPPTSVRPATQPASPSQAPARRPSIQPSTPPTSVRPATQPASPSQAPARRPSIQPPAPARTATQPPTAQPPAPVSQGSARRPIVQPSTPPAPVSTPVIKASQPPAPVSTPAVKASQPPASAAPAGRDDIDTEPPAPPAPPAPTTPAAARGDVDTEPPTPPDEAETATEPPSDADGLTDIPPPPMMTGADLEELEAFADLPEEMHEQLARAARVELLTPDEEVAGFGVALVLDGEASVCTSIVDTPALHAVQKTLVPSRGTLPEGIPLRVVAAASGARVAVWEQEIIDDALRTCPWVVDELRDVADRLQAFAGATIGPVGELDDDSLGAVLQRLRVQALGPGETIVLADHPMPGLVVVGAGTVELIDDGEAEPTGAARPGDVLFAAALLSGQPAPATARAASSGALLLIGEHRALRELFERVPELIGLLSADL